MQYEAMQRYMDAAAAVVDIRVPGHARDGVLTYLQLAGSMAALVQAQPLQPRDGPAMVMAEPEHQP